MPRPSLIACSDTESPARSTRCPLCTSAAADASHPRGWCADCCSTLAQHACDAIVRRALAFAAVARIERAAGDAACRDDDAAYGRLSRASRRATTGWPRDLWFELVRVSDRVAVATAGAL